MINKFSAWHNVSPGDQLPNIVNGIIEIPKGSRAKYELDKESGFLKMDRVYILLFIILQIIGVILCIIFPSIITYLPAMFFGK